MPQINRISSTARRKLTTLRAGRAAVRSRNAPVAPESPLAWLAAYGELIPSIASHSDGERDDGASWFARTRQTLRELHEPHRAAASMLAVRLVGHEGTPLERTARLRACLDQAVAALSASRRGRRAMAALKATYLDPGATQEEVAEALLLPFSTYRRHLNEGIQLLADYLRATQ